MSENIKAVLVNLSIPIMPNAKEDTGLTEEFRKKKKLGKNAGKWRKYLLPDHAFKKMRKVASTFRNQIHYRLTLPWEDGRQLLTAEVHDRYMEAAHASQVAFGEALSEFKARYDKPYTVPVVSDDTSEYFDLLDSLEMQRPKIKGDEMEIPSLIEQARIMHNGTFNPDLYKPWSEIEEKFGFTVAKEPVPKSSHFINSGIAAEAVEEMKEQLDQRNESRVKAAVEDVWVRLIEPVQHLADALANPETIFRDTLIGNVREIVELVPKLNLTNNTELARMAKQIEDKFANLNPEDLRSNESVRKETTEAAKSVLRSFGKIGKRRFA